MLGLTSNELTTPRLLLLPAGPAFLQAVIERDFAAAGALYQLTVPPTWPGDRAAVDGLAIHLRELEADPRELLWRVRLIVLKEDRIVIGSINVKGLPRDGRVEIGWGLLPSLRRLGFAREAVASVLQWLKAQPEVRRIIATIDDDNTASIRLATHIGMRRTDERHRDTPVYELTDW